MPYLSAKSQIAFLAIAYSGLGALGLMLAIPPGYASPVFPAAGLALAASLWLGPRALAGIWLGSALLNVGQTWLHGTLTPATLSMVAVIATGATAQAWAGRWLVQRWQGATWLALEREQDALFFLLLGGVLACLVSASMGVSGLHAAGVIDRSEFFFTWWTWYVGDALGVLVFAPLTLCLLQRQDGLWRERRRLIVAPMLLTLSLAGLTFYGAARWEERTQSRQIEADGEGIAKHIRDRLIAHREILASLRNFIEVTPNFSFGQFEQFTKITLKDNPDIFALSFNDLVSNDDRPAFERAMSRLSPLGPFQITERDSQRRLVRASQRPEYVVVRYIAPLRGNEPAVGFDIHSEPKRRDAIRHAMASKTWTVTAPLQLVQERQQRPGILQLLPVEGRSTGTLREADRLVGFAVSVVKVDQMIEIATQGLVPPGLIFQLSDPLASNGQHVLYRSSSADQATSTRQAPWKTTLRLGDRVWDLSVRTTESYRRQHRPWLAWAVGVVGLVFATLLQILMLGVTGSSAMIQRKKAQLLLAEKVFDNSGEAIVVTDGSGHVLSTNPAFSRVTGYSAEEARGKNMRLMGSGRHSPVFFQEMWRRLSVATHWQGEIWNRRKNGDIYPAWMTIAVVRDADEAVTHYVGTFSDVTEHKAAQDRIEFLAYHDPLTQLPNRLLGKDHVQQAIAQGQRHGTMVAVLFMDLDNFKLINDSFGHTVGDMLLQSVAQRLTTCVRDADTVCRISGDEFLIVLSEVSDHHEITAVCDRVVRLLSEPFNSDHGSLTTSASMGVAVYPDDGADTETLLRGADTAMYEAKKGGRNTYRFFDQQMNDEVLRYVQLRDALRLALDRQEFELHYQPQICLSSGEVVGVEALIRWRHPELGLQSPGYFIPTAEDSGLIVPIGEWVLREACRQAAQWREAGLDFGVVGVNLSAAQFQRGHIEQVVVDALRDAGLEPTRLELELTESILIQDEEGVFSTVSRLKALGVKMAIDDFGTGYSSFAYLKRFTVDRLKIDQSFVRGMVDDAGDRAIVRAVIQMAKSLNVRSLAEGVEHEDVQNLLRELGCDEVQGYLYARPMPAAELSAYLRVRAQGAATKPRP